MAHTHNQTIRQGWNRLKYFGILMLVFGSLFVLSQLVVGRVNAIESTHETLLLSNKSKLGDISPNPDGNIMYKGSTDYRASLFNKKSNPSSGTGFKHILKSTGSSRVNKLELKAYYDTREAAENASFKLRWDNSVSKDCEFATAENKNQVIDFKINGTIYFSTAANEASPSSTKSGICKDFNSTYNVNEAPGGNRPGEPVEIAEGLFVNTLNFELKQNGTPYDGGKQNHIRFQIRATGSGNPRIGHTKTADEQSYGIVESYGKDEGGTKDNVSVATAIRFGKSCSQINSPTRVGKIQLYDPDVNLFGESYVNVYKKPRGGGSDWTRLKYNPDNAKSDYSSDSLIENKVDWAGAEGWRIKKGNDKTATISIKEYDYENQYLMILDNPYEKNTRLTPTGNVLGYSLPGDPINGETNGCKGAYKLVPSAAVAPSGQTAGGSVIATGIVRNDSSDTDAGSHEWNMVVLRYGKGVDPTTSFNSSEADLCRLATVECATLTSPTDEFGPSATRSHTANYTIASDAEVGERYCFITSVRKPRDTSSDGVWARSGGADACVVVGKKPKLQVWGYDAKVLGLVNTSLSTGSTTYGSWAEYGLLSNGKSSGMASGAGLNSGGNSDQASWSELTFANKLDVGGFGLYGGLAPVSIAQQGEQFEGDADWSAIKNQCQGTTATCVVKGTLTIDENIAYANTSSIGDLKRTVLVADNIIVERGVSRIDAWLAAVEDADGNGGNISTCDAARVGTNLFPSYSEASLTVDMCEEPITFNGPVLASNVYLYRTAGNTTGSPSERFNLRPDAFLSSFAGGRSSTIANTDTITELPPRF